MADSLQSMIANRLQGETRARLQRFYMEQGYPPDVAAAKATVEMARRSADPATDGDSPSERIANTRLNDPIAAYREMVDTGRLDRANYGDQDISASGSSFRMTPEQRQQLADINRQGIRSLSELDPRFGGFRSTMPESEYFRETAPTAQDMAAEAERRRNSQDLYEATFGRPRPTMSREEQQLHDQELARQGRLAGAEPQGSALSRWLGYRPQQGQTPPTYATSSYQGSTPPQTSFIDRALDASANAQERFENRFNPPAPPAAVRETPPPAPVVAEEAGEPGFSGEQGRILQQALEASRAATQGAPAPAPAAAAAVIRRPAPAVARPQQQAAAPSAAPAAQQQGSWFSNLFKDPYEGKSARDLYHLAQERGSEDPSYNSLMTRALSMDKAEPKEEGMNRGGTAGGKKDKDAVVMKALEIIHHMLRTR